MTSRCPPAPPRPSTGLQSQQLCPSGLSGQKPGLSFPFCPRSKLSELPTVALGCVGSGYVLPCPRPSGSDHWVCLQYSPNLSPRVSPAPHLSFPRGQRPGPTETPGQSEPTLQYFWPPGCSWATRGSASASSPSVFLERSSPGPHVSLLSALGLASLPSSWSRAVSSDTRVL